MSDYDYCKKHDMSYLMPEYIDCPLCWLEAICPDTPENKDMLKEFTDDYKSLLKKRSED